ncbi:MarR family transcriptional regulator [Streptomyces sp. NPDC096048]|uniref:MarR family transcriptional regulator n=1 Tax=Streptomyces sp. NPDC096048 TaxID=3366072 RepID=UPI00382621B2
MLCRMPTRDSPPTPSARREALVLDLLRTNGPLSRSTLQEISGLSRTTLYDTVAKLVADGAVVASRLDSDRRRRGRPVEKLDINSWPGRRTTKENMTDGHQRRCDVSAFLPSRRCGPGSCGGTAHDCRPGPTSGTGE